MNWEKELEKELKKIKKVFWKTFIKSREFKKFKRRLQELDLDTDVFLAMFIFGEHKHRSRVSRKVKDRVVRREVSKKLTQKDKEFLKAHGIKWE